MKEKFAKLAHEQWSGWMNYIFSKCTKTDAGELIIPKWAVDRWKKQANTPYSELTTAEMDSDRKEADKFLSLLEPEPTELNISDKFVEALINDIRQKDKIKALPHKIFIELLTNRVWGKLQLMTFESNLIDEAIDRIDRLTAENEELKRGSSW